MGAQEWALALLGIGILSEQFGGGQGLISLGTGVQTLVAAPLKGTGTGLTSLAGGLTDIATAFGGILEGLSDLLKVIPSVPGMPGLPTGNGNGNGNGNGPDLIPLGGGDDSGLEPGGGGNVPTPPPPILPIAPVPPLIPPPTLFGLSPAPTGGSTRMDVY